jgi:hypothetical protein
MKHEFGIVFILLGISLISVIYGMILFFNGDISTIDCVKILLIGGISPLLGIVSAYCFNNN